jgi:hypothetical protein
MYCWSCDTRIWDTDPPPEDIRKRAYRVEVRRPPAPMAEKVCHECWVVAQRKVIWPVGVTS